MSTRPLLQTATYEVGGVVGCSWKDGGLAAVLDVCEITSDGPDSYICGEVTLTCSNTEYVLFAEEAVADRKDLLIQDSHDQAIPNVQGIYVSRISRLLLQLKSGEDFGEYVNAAARHYIVRTPYNSFEFISSATPVLSEMTIASS